MKVVGMMYHAFISLFMMNKIVNFPHLLVMFDDINAYMSNTLAQKKTGIDSNVTDMLLIIRCWATRVFVNNIDLRQLNMQ